MSATSDDGSLTISSPDPGLSSLEVCGVVSVLEDTIDQLRILAFTEQKEQVDIKLEFLTLEERLGKPHKVTDVLEWASKGLPGSKEQDNPFTKIQTDRAYAEKLLELTLEELLDTGSFASLEDMVNRAAELKQQEDKLLSDEITNTGYVAYLKKQLKEELVQKTAQLTQKDEQIARLKDEIQSVVYHSELERDYLHKWEGARSGQNALRLKLAEKELEEQLDKLRVKLDMETFVHDEKQNFLMQEQTNTENSLEYWMEKYYEDTDAKQVEITELTEKRRQNNKLLEELQKKFQQQQEEIAEYLAVKEERDRQHAHNLLLNSAATRIQAWWKGTMVRRGLGPYKKRKAKDKGKGRKAARKR